MKNEFRPDYERYGMANMKRALIALPIVVLLSLLLGQCESRAQTVGGTPLRDIKTEYVQIVGTSKLLSLKLTIEIDFGQENLSNTRRDTQLRDENDKRIEFNSMIDALNFMTANGYEFVQAYAVSSSSQNVYHYLLHRKK